VRPSWVEVDLDAVADNVASVIAAVAPTKVCVVVKADGYGHGDVPVAEAALGAGAHLLAVALVEEGERLREAGIDAPVLVLSEPPIEAVERIHTWKLTPTVYTEGFIDALAARGTNETPIPVHLKVDTGMHRVGCPPDVAFGLAARIAESDRLRLEGLWTHLAVAEEDPRITVGQIETLVRLQQRLADAGIRPDMVHAANTAGALAHPVSRLDMVRLGLGAYGMRPAPHIGAEVPLRPAMRVVSHVSHIARHPAGTRLSYGLRRPLPVDATVVTVPIGYADGVARRLSAVDGEVLIGGFRHPFAGTVTMDQIVVDVGDHPVRVGDEVVLLGSQGSDAITAEEWALHLDTINYEIVCRFGNRLPRRYRGGPS